MQIFHHKQIIEYIIKFFFILKHMHASLYIVNKIIHNIKKKKTFTFKNIKNYKFL